MDGIIFGDNQFFGINHMSEEKAQAQAERFKDINSIIQVVDTAYDCGIHAFMFNTHAKVAQLCDHFRANPDCYADLRLYISLPYAHKYANAVAEKGMIGALNECIFKDRSAPQVVSTIARGGMSIVKSNVIEVMKLLIDVEMRMFHGLDVRAIFLQNIVTDLLLGLGIKQIFVEFVTYISEKYRVDPAFITLNMPSLVSFLLNCGIKDPIVCSAINRIGYFMNPDRQSYEETIRTKPFRPMAMSIFASGAISLKEAVEYVVSQKNIRAIVFGASSKAHIQQTRNMIHNCERIAAHESAGSVCPYIRHSLRHDTERATTHIKNARITRIADPH